LSVLTFDTLNKEIRFSRENNIFTLRTLKEKNKNKTEMSSSIVQSNIFLAKTEQLKKSERSVKRVAKTSAFAQSSSSSEECTRRNVMKSIVVSSLFG